MTTAVVGFLGNSCGVADRAGDFTQLVGSVGENTGNLLFQGACWSLITNEKEAFRLGVDLDVDSFRRKIDVLFIPAANQINAEWDLDGWGGLIAYLDKPVVIAGLGYQQRIGVQKPLDLKPGTVRFLKEVEKRAVLIGVRGEQSLAVLEGLNIKSGIITGCPSNFISREISGISIEAEISRARLNRDPAVHYVFGTMEDYARDTEANLFAICRNSLGFIIYQTDPALLQYLHDQVVRASFFSDMDWQNKRLLTGISTQDYLRIIRERGRAFYSMPEWIDWCRNADLTIGMRIHGCIAAIQAGRLGVCVAFDGRTLELVETMGYPHLLPQDLNGMSCISEVVGKIRFSPRLFDVKRSMLWQNLLMAMTQHGIVVKQ